MVKSSIFTKIIAFFLVLTIGLTAIPNAVYALTTLNLDKPTSVDETTEIA